MTTTTHPPSSEASAFADLDALLPDLEELYKDIHAHPELSMQETRTAGIAAQRLRDAGYDVTTGVGKTGVVGLLRNGDGPVVMLRADKDACRSRKRPICPMPAMSPQPMLKALPYR